MEKIPVSGAWRSEASCKGTPIQRFFPQEGTDVDHEVRAMCQACPVIEDCLEYALRYEGHGYFGGTSATQRHRLRRDRKIALFSPQLNSLR